MDGWLIALIVKPITALIILGFICLPARIAVQRWMKPGKLKSFLLRPAGGATNHPYRPEKDLTKTVIHGRVAELPEWRWGSLFKRSRLDKTR